jgi:hypothetical protein
VRKRRLLADLRETAKLRGFHLGSALRVAAAELRDVDIWYLGGDRPDELLAIKAIAFDTGLRLRRWHRPALGIGRKIDLYVAAAERIPQDKRFVQARKAARRCLIGLVFSGPAPDPDIQTVPANDIVAFARAISASVAGDANEVKLARKMNAR